MDVRYVNQNKKYNVKNVKNIKQSGLVPKETGKQVKFYAVSFTPLPVPLNYFPNLSFIFQALNSF